MHQNSTILIVDDDTNSITIAMQLLKQYKLLTAFDGASALEIVHKENIDLILLDIMLPLMDGYELAQKLKEKEKTAHIPIIFLSARTHHDAIKKAFECGGVDYLTKPFHPSELLARIQTHLQLYNYQQKLEEQVQKEIEKNRLKEQLITEQSKQAAMGELLIHISHQWKQPLSSLNSLYSLLKAKIDAQIPLENQQLLQINTEAKRQIDFMTHTVDTFKNFYQDTNQQQHFTLSEALEYVLNLLQASLEYEGIRIYCNRSQQMQIYANLHEVVQILFSIFINMRDIFRLRSVTNPEIICTIKNKEIALEDNGGGIANNAYEAIFEKQMSTHKQSGMGLYIAQVIAQKNKLSLSAINTQRGAYFLLKTDES